MITREEIRQLAQAESPSGCAISFYFQPQTPKDKSHREEAILVKDLVKDAVRKAERNGNHQALRDDLQKILEMAEHLHGNHSRGKAIFACGEQGIWREMDAPARLGRSTIIVNSRFHLMPLVAAYSSLHRVPLTEEVAKEVLSDLLPAARPRIITPTLILEETAKMFGWTVDDLCGKSRRRPLVTARQIGMYVFRELTEFSYPAIAREFGGRDHTTVIHAVEKVSALMKERRQIYDQVTELLHLIRSGG